MANSCNHNRQISSSGQMQLFHSVSNILHIAWVTVSSCVSGRGKRARSSYEVDADIEAGPRGKQVSGQR